MIERTTRDGVAWVRFSHPPVNTLSVGADVVDGLARALRAAIADPAVRAIVIAASGRVFCGGADIADFDTHPDTLERMRTLTSDVVEQASKPIIIAIHGLTLGGGLELAMAGHYRIACAAAQFGLPEVSLGLLPGGGGTQRLPRLVGAEAALRLLLDGGTVTAVEALNLGLIDRIATAFLDAEAHEWAVSVAKARPRRTCDRAPPMLADHALAAVERRAAASRLNRAPAYIVECVQAACRLPFVEGMALEKQRFEALLCSEAAMGLRHVFWGRREVANVQVPPPDAPLPDVASVAVVGAGLMGTGIALALLIADIPVTLVDLAAPARERALASIHRSLERERQKGRLDAAAVARSAARLRVTADLAAAGSADLVIEAVYESLEVKQQVFVALDRLAKPGAILGSNTSTLDLNAIAAVTRRPSHVVGLHFFSPAHIMKLIEIVHAEATAPEVLNAAMRFAKRIGKVGVSVGVCDGFVGNRMFEEYLRQAYFLLEEGALPAQIDGALERWGMAMGPLKTMDLAGQDIGWSIRKRRQVDQPERPYSRIPDLICEQGRFGQKTGVGFYRYADGRTAVSDPAIDELIRAHSAAIGVGRREISDAEIVDRCVLALVNEGARIIEEGIARRSVDVDMIWVFGYGFPAERGGPMFHADRIGRSLVLNRMRAFAAGPNGWAWQPARSLATASVGGT